MNRKEEIHNLSFKHKQKFKLLSKNKSGAFNVKYIQHRDGSARLAGIDHMIFGNYYRIKSQLWIEMTLKMLQE